jgi:hypothetical protein
MSNHENPTQTGQVRLRVHFPKALLGGGLLIGLVGIYFTSGWFQGFLLVLATVCFVASYWLSYMENAGSD